MADRHHVVVIGSGFGGLFAAKALRHPRIDVTMISRTTHHLFQPLLYQVATGILSEGEIAPPTREILRRQRNVQVLLGDVESIDVAARTVTSMAGGHTAVTSYDSLIVAAGARTSYFGDQHFAEHAPGLKTIDDALELRGRILGAFEFAELEDDDTAREAWQTFVVVGAGATGVELAGQISELSRRTLRRDYRTVHPRKTRIVLVDAGSAVLGSFGSRLSDKAKAQVEHMGIEVELDRKVTEVDEGGLTYEDHDGTQTRIASRTVVWAAGVEAAPIGRVLADQTGAEVDRAGRIKVEPDCTLPGHPEIFAIGDMMTLNDLPGVAQVAMQQGKYAAGQIKHRVNGQEPKIIFDYFDKGSMATVSRFKAVASIGRFRFGGLVAWLLWLVVHLLYLVGFKNRITTVLHWAVSFLGRSRSERTITNQQLLERVGSRETEPGPRLDGSDPPLAPSTQALRAGEAAR